MLGFIPVKVIPDAPNVSLQLLTSLNHKILQIFPYTHYSLYKGLILSPIFDHLYSCRTIITAFIWNNI